MRYDKQSGFVALMSVIIILAVLLMVSASISFTSFSSRFNVSDAEYKKRSSALAEACLNAELLKLAQGSTYANGSIVNVGGDSCTIVSTDYPSNPTTIKTQGVFPPAQPQRSFTNLTVVASSTGLSVISWVETGQ